MVKFNSSSVLAFLSLNALSDAFSVNPVVHVNVRGPSRFAPSSRNGSLLKSSAEDEVAALRAAAAKAREEAQRLEKAMGKEVTASPTATVEKKEPPKLSSDEVVKSITTIDFQGDANSQVSELNSLVEKRQLGLWKAALTSSANTNSPSPLRPYPVSLNFLEQRTGGKVTGSSLGIGGEDDVSLDDFKYATLWVTLGSSVGGIAALAFLPGNIGATICYFLALIPILFLAVGSTVPALIAGAIKSVRGTSEEKSEQEDRVCQHEAGHFLTGYLCGLPIKSYQINDLGYPCVEFYAATDGDAMGRELSSEEIAALSVVALSGSVAEILSFGQAKGGDNDLLQLDGWMRQSADFVGAQKQQDLVRWGALASYNLLMGNNDKYEKLVEAFRAKKSVTECIAVIEGTN